MRGARRKLVAIVARTILITILIPPIFAIVVPRTQARLVSDGDGGFVAKASALSEISQFSGLTALTESTLVPSDVQVAVGPTQVVELLHWDMAIYSKSGVFWSKTPLTTLFQVFGFLSPDRIHHIYDVQLLYDASSSTWFATIADAVGSLAPGPDTLCQPNCYDFYVDLAVSQYSDATAPWRVYHLHTGFNSYDPSGVGLTPYWGIDRPQLGISDDKITVTSAFTYQCDPTSTNGCNTIQYWIVGKNAAIQGQTVNCDASTNCNRGIVDYNGKGNLAPVQSLSSTTTQYLVGINSGSSLLELWSVTGTPPTASIGLVHSFNTLSFTATPWAPQAGTNDTIRMDSAAFVYSAVWSLNKLWLASEWGCTPNGDIQGQTRDCIHLIQLETSLMLNLQDWNYGIPGRYLFRPALTIDSQGDMAMIFGYSSKSNVPGGSDIYPSLAATGQAYGDFVNTSSPSIDLVLGSASALWTRNSKTGAVTDKRFGDYFGASLDPSDPTLIRVAGVYEAAANNPCAMGSGDTASTGSCWSTSINSLRVVGLSMWASPSTLTVQPGSTVVTGVSVQGLGSLSGTISLSSTVAPSAEGFSTWVSPSSIQLPLGGRNTTTASVYALNFKYGSYNLTVTATVPGLSLTLPVHLYLPAAPVCSVGASPTSGYISVTVQFTASCSGGAPPYGYYWQFGDGATSTAQNPSHTYSNPYSYNLRFYPTLKVSDTIGYITPAVPSIYVDGSPCTGSRIC